jgi:hypothetical protein
MLANTIEATWMHLKVTLRRYCENKVICVINGLKGSLLAGFDDVPELIVQCCVYYHSLGPYIPFIFLIGCFRDILKITKIKLYLRKHAVCYGVCYLLCSKYLKPLIFLNC